MKRSEQFLGHAVLLRLVEEPPLDGLAPYEYVFGDCKILHKVKLLMHYAYALCLSVPGPVYLDRAAEKFYRAGVLSVHAGEYLHKSRFTGAVFPDQCHDLPRLYLKPGVIKRVHAGKILLYTVHSQNRFSHYGFTFLYLIKKQSVEDGLNGENEPFRVFV